MIELYSRDARPGHPGHPDDRWSNLSPLERSLDHWTLVAFLDPRCPCSMATAGEIEVLLANSNSQCVTHIVVEGQQDEARGYFFASSLKNLSAIPGVSVHWDYDGIAARAFGATTSGQILLYRADGKLVFNGGITASRSHQGSNDGLDAVLRWIRSEAPYVEQFPIFGCSLRSSQGDRGPTL